MNLKKNTNQWLLWSYQPWDQSILGERVAVVGQFLQTVLTMENTSINIKKIPIKYEFLKSVLFLKN